MVRLWRARRRAREVRWDWARLVRLTGAAAAAYATALAVVASQRPVLAPLTALLVVQLTSVASLTSSVQRVVSVVAGVLIALGFAEVVALTVTSLALVVGISLLVGQVLRLGDHLLEVPISAMLVLAVGGSAGAASDRVQETLVGAAVGVALALLVPPRLRTLDAATALERHADRMADLLHRAADGIAVGLTTSVARELLEEARRLDTDVVALDSLLAEVDRSLALNVRAVGAIRTGTTLQGGLDALEHLAVSIRSLLRTVLDQLAVADDEDRLADEPADGDAPRQLAREALGTLLHEVADATSSFGALLAREPLAGAANDPATLEGSLESLREARARLTELLLVDPRDHPGLWEIGGAVLGTVDRVLRELDARAHASRRASARSPRLRRARQAAHDVRSAPWRRPRP